MRAAARLHIGRPGWAHAGYHQRPRTNASAAWTSTPGTEFATLGTLVQIVSSWVISGTQVSPSDLTSDALLFGPPATQPGLSFGLFTDAAGDAFAEIFNAAGDSSNVVGLAPTGISICDGSGTLIVTDELILNPAKLTRIRRFTGTMVSPCAEMEEAMEEAETEMVPLNEAFLADLEFELSGNKTTATIPISALVNSTAFDDDGNEVPVSTNVALALMNDLDASLNAAGTEFNVRSARSRRRVQSPDAVHSRFLCP